MRHDDEREQLVFCAHHAGASPRIRPDRADSVPRRFGCEGGHAEARHVRPAGDPGASKRPEGSISASPIRPLCGVRSQEPLRGRIVGACSRDGPTGRSARPVSGSRRVSPMLDPHLQRRRHPASPEPRAHTGLRPRLVGATARPVSSPPLGSSSLAVTIAMDSGDRCGLASLDHEAGSQLPRRCLARRPS
jgi:hypothetical protein